MADNYRPRRGAVIANSPQASINEATWRKKDVAVKRKRKEEAELEIEAYRKVNYNPPHIVCLHDVFEHGSYCDLILDRAECNLLELIKHFAGKRRLSQIQNAKTKSFLGKVLRNHDLWDNYQNPTPLLHEIMRYYALINYILFYFYCRIRIFYCFSFMF